MEIIKLYINMNSSLIELRDNQKRKKALATNCTDYYNCVQANSRLVEQYKTLSPEISHIFVHQRFDVNTLKQNFEQLEAIDLKIRELQRKMPEIQKYLKTDSANIESVIRQFVNDLYFDQMDEVEEWIDSVFNELTRRIQERIDRNERWKSTGKAVIKNSANFLWKTVNK